MTFVPDLSNAFDKSIKPLVLLGKNWRQKHDKFVSY